MRGLSGLIFLFLFSLPNAFGQEAAGSSTVTFGVGGGWVPGNSGGMSGGPAFNGTYEFRIHRYLSFEAGVDTTLTASYYSSFAQTFSVINAGESLVSSSGGARFWYRGSSRSTSAPFGFRGILPLVRGRVEVFAGGGGSYIWDSNPRQQAWAIQATAGARVAIDQQRHFWLGTTGRFTHEFQSYYQDRVGWTADLGFRFGR